MASRQEDGKKILAAFVKMHAAGSEMNDILCEMGKDVGEPGKEDHNKRITMYSMLANMKMIRAVFNEMHHSIGHLLFSQCWEETEVGEEDLTGEGLTNNLKELLDHIGLALVDAEMIDLSKPLPDHLPPELKKEIESLRKAHEGASKSHLH